MTVGIKFDGDDKKRHRNLTHSREMSKVPYGLTMMEVTAKRTWARRYMAQRRW
jgi:hypothetical protein